MKENKILLAGASGYLGRHIAAELQERKYPAKIVVRNTNKIPPDSGGLEVLVAEVTRAETLTGIMNDVETVISTVGITKQKDGLAYMDVDYQANLNLLHEAERAGVKKFIYVSAFNADKLVRLKMAYAKEKFVEALKNSTLEYCIVRPNGFFSDMAEFMKMAKKGKVELFGDGSFRMNPIDGKDLAELCVNAIGSDEKEIEAGGPEVLTHKEIAVLAFNTLGKEVKISFMPDWVRRMVLWFARSFTSSKSYGPLEFFFTVLAMDMVAPRFGTHSLKNYFEEIKAGYL